jgi:hypothetical protein
MSVFNLAQKQSFPPTTAHSVFFGPFLSGCFFPPNDRAQNHDQENPLLVLFMLAQKCLWTLRVQKCAKNHTFLIAVLSGRQ